MPRPIIRLAVWILTLLFHLVVTGNKTYPVFPEQDVLFLDPQGVRLARGPSGSFWKQRPSRNESVETVGFPSKILQTARNIDLEKDYENASVNRRTLMDYNGPVIMEDLENTSDQDSPSYIRVKRNEQTVCRRSNRTTKFDSFPGNPRRGIDATSIFGNSILEESHLDRGNRSDVTMDYTVASRSRRKRGILPKSGYRRKRVKGNVGMHSKRNRVAIRNGKKKLDDSKTSYRSVKKKTNNPNSREGSKNTREIGMPARTIGEFRIEKRESGNSGLNANIDAVEKEEGLISQKEDASLKNNRSFAERRKENTVMLPFVHTGRAELRVRIEKLPTNESLISPNHSGMDHSVGTSPCPMMLPKYNASDEILDVNVTNLKLAPNFNPVVERKINNLTLEIMLKKLDQGNDTSVLGDPESAFYNMESHPASVESNVPGIEEDRSTEDEKYDRTNEMPAGFSEDEKSRAKRNQEILSKRYPHSDKESRHFKGASTEDTKTRYSRTRGNRPVRSIEEIKNLAEKLVVKINELQAYVNDRNETLYARDSCLDKGAVRAIEEEPSVPLEKKDVSSSTSKVAKNVNNRQHFAEEAALAGKRASQVRSGGSRFARGESRTRRGSRRKWGRWMDWSSCSVTCGRGRQIRWRHCLHDCNEAETEMEEKACQLPACPPSKFLGIF